MMRFSRKGFTLVELMLVVIILGVLVAMVMPRLAGRTEQAKRAAAKADIEANIGSALDLFEIDNGSYPEELSELRENKRSLKGWKGPYIKKDPIDPWGNVYKYKRVGTASYELRSSGSNGIEGDADDVVSGQDDTAK